MINREFFPDCPTHIHEMLNAILSVIDEWKLTESDMFGLPRMVQYVYVLALDWTSIRDN